MGSISTKRTYKNKKEKEEIKKKNTSECFLKSGGLRGPKWRLLWDSRNIEFHSSCKHVSGAWTKHGRAGLKENVTSNSGSVYI